MDAGRPFLRILTVGGVKCVIECLLRGGESIECLLNIGEHVVANRNDQERILREDARTVCDGFDADASIAFSRNGAYFIVLVAYYSRCQCRGSHINAHAWCSKRDRLDGAPKHSDLPGVVGIIPNSMAAVWWVMQVEGVELEIGRHDPPMSVCYPCDDGASFLTYATFNLCCRLRLHIRHSER